jgi:hypothetical protein
MKSEAVESQDDCPKKFALLTPLFIGIISFTNFESITATKNTDNNVKRYNSGTLNNLK